METAGKRLNFLKGGGDIGQLIRAMDWSTSPLGKPETWPPGLRTSVSILLNSQFPMFIWWGPQLITIYNDAYRIIAGKKHPASLGGPGAEVWSEIWDVVGPMAQQVMEEGASTWAEDQLLYINRTGVVEETYFTFSYSPVFNEDGKVGGVFCACSETTEKVIAARRLKESEENFRNLVVQAPVAICILSGPKHIVELANERMLQVMGRTQDIIGKPILQSLPEADVQGLLGMLDAIRQSGKPHKVSNFPATILIDGVKEDRYFDLIFKPYFQKSTDTEPAGIFCVAHNTTEQVVARRKVEQNEVELQKRVQERTVALEQQKTLLDNILKYSPSGIAVSEVIQNETGKIHGFKNILVNKAAEMLSGLSQKIEAINNNDIGAAFSDSPYHQKALVTLQTGEPFVFQFPVETSGKWIEVATSKMDAQHLINVFTEVTESKTTQLQLEKYVEDLRRSNANLEEFAYAASHDLKEPVRKIRFFTDRLKHRLAGRLEEEEQRFFERMEHAAKRMGSLIDDLLLYSHISKGGAMEETVDLNEKVTLVLQDLELEIEEKKASINVDPLPVIKGYRRQLQQLFQNLVSNALKYGRPGTPPEVFIHYKRIKGMDTDLHLAGEEGAKEYHLIEVADNGIGFEQADAERIFNVFTRLHGNTEYRGTGVGLSIVRKVAENHGGYIWAKSQPGKGATFKVLLPCI